MLNHRPISLIVFAPLRLCVNQFRALFLATAIALFVDKAQAQDGSLISAPPLSPKQMAPLNLENTCFMYRKLPPEAEQRELQLHDIITVLVDYRSALQSDGDANSKKTASFNAVLSDWLKFDGKNIEPAKQLSGDPRINGSLTSQYKTQADIQQKDALTFKIAADVVDIRPNGNLVIDGRSDVQVNDEVWEQSISGVVRRQ